MSCIYNRACIFLLNVFLFRLPLLVKHANSFIPMLNVVFRPYKNECLFYAADYNDLKPEFTGGNIIVHKFTELYNNNSEYYNYCY